MRSGPLPGARAGGEDDSVGGSDRLRGLLGVDVLEIADDRFRAELGDLGLLVGVADHRDDLVIPLDQHPGQLLGNLSVPPGNRYAHS